MSGDDLRRWYWLKDELVDFARSIGISTAGGKATLTARLAAALDGLPFAEPATGRSRTTPQLSGNLTSATVIPRGQRCSQPARVWFIQRVGSSFRLDDRMRSFFAETDGTQTLQDALDHYRTTRHREPRSIDSQFEYNRFTRAWRAENVGRSADDLRQASQHYRYSPVEERGRI